VRIEERGKLRFMGCLIPALQKGSFFKAKWNRKREREREREILELLIGASCQALIETDDNNTVYAYWFRAGPFCYHCGGSNHATGNP